MRNPHPVFPSDLPALGCIVKMRHHGLTRERGCVIFQCFHFHETNATGQQSDVIPVAVVLLNNHLIPQMRYRRRDLLDPDLIRLHHARRRAQRQGR